MQGVIQMGMTHCKAISSNIILKNEDEIIYLKLYLKLETII